MRWVMNNFELLIINVWEMTTAMMKELKKEDQEKNFSVVNTLRICKSACEFN